jgi:hypothetical protein
MPPRALIPTLTLSRWATSSPPSPSAGGLPHPHPHPQQVGYPDGRLVSPTAVAASGASVLNLHQGVDGWLAPHINSPLQPLAATRLGGYVARAHALGLRAKLYYTVRHICT